jgi:hypothetical protein
MKADRKDWIWFIIVSVIYILWVIWLNNFWFLLGLGIIFDLYITKKVNWTFWKRREGENSKFIWVSLDKNKNFFDRIRWERMLKGV